MAQKVNPAFSHIASLIRAKMAEKEIRASDLHQALGYKRNATILYTWINSTSAPNDEIRPKLAKLLDVDEQELMPKDHVVLARTPRTSMVPSKAVIVTASNPRVMPKPNEVLGFSVNQQGMARIKLDVELPLDTAAGLLRMLLDAGVVMTRLPPEED